MYAVPALVGSTVQRRARQPPPMSLTRRILLWASANPWMKRTLPRFLFVRRALTRFMPGETLEAALGAVRELSAQGLPTVLTFLGENVHSIEEARAVRDHYLTVLDSIRAGHHPTEISVKLTQLGLDIDPGTTLARMREILVAAERAQNFVWIDMESSPYVDRTLELYSALRSEFSHVGLCLQAYLRRTEDDLRSLAGLSPSIRLVKGAYREPDAVALRRKTDVDRNFALLAERLLKELPDPRSRIAIATHDVALAAAVKASAERLGLPRERIEFQMLYGIGREAQRRLIREGYRVRILVSYGSAWFPWYMRRLAERPANVWFVVRSLFVR